MLKLPCDLFRSLLLILDPPDLCSTRSTCSQILNLLKDPNESERFYCSYWKYLCRRSFYLSKYKLDPSWCYGSYRVLVANQLVRVGPVMDLFVLAETNVNLEIEVYNDSNSHITQISRSDNIQYIFTYYKIKLTISEGGAPTPSPATAEILIDILLDNRHRIDQYLKQYNLSRSYDWFGLWKVNINPDQPIGKIQNYYINSREIRSLN